MVVRFVLEGRAHQRLVNIGDGIIKSSVWLSFPFKGKKYSGFFHHGTEWKVLGKDGRKFSHLAVSVRRLGGLNKKATSAIASPKAGLGSLFPFWGKPSEWLPSRNRVERFSEGRIPNLKLDHFRKPLQGSPHISSGGLGGGRPVSCSWISSYRARRAASDPARHGRPNGGGSSTMGNRGLIEFQDPDSFSL